MDEVVAGVQPQEARQPKPVQKGSKARGEVAGGPQPTTVNPAGKDQCGENGHDLVPEGMGHQLAQADGLGLNVLRSPLLRLRQQLQITIQNAGSREIEHLLKTLVVKTGQ